MSRCLCIGKQDMEAGTDTYGAAEGAFKSTRP
jgi:hypothetical protein